MRFAFHQRTEDGGVDWIGQVVSQSKGNITINVVDAVLATGAGMWELTDEIKDCPPSECRVFLERDACLRTAVEINARLYPRSHSYQ